MGSFNRIALAGLFGLAATTALAADFPYPAPPPVMPPPPAPVEVGGGWYLRGDVGVGILDFDKFEGVNTTVPVGFVPPPGGYRLDSKVAADQAFVGFGFGWQFNSWFRADVTGEYRSAAQIKTTESYIYPGQPFRSANIVDGKLSSVVGLVNAYFDLGSWGGFSPFVGAGVGFARHKTMGFTDVGIGFAGGGGGYGIDKDRTGLAWAIHAGIGYDVTPNVKLELAYRYLNMGKAEAGPITCYAAPGACLSTVYTYKTLDSHDLKIGMRWMFGAPVAMAPMPMGEPIMRKY